MSDLSHLPEAKAPHCKFTLNHGYRATLQNALIEWREARLAILDLPAETVTPEQRARIDHAEDWLLKLARSL